MSSLLPGLGTGMVTEILFLPDGCTTEHPDWDVFSTWVVWRGAGLYAVQQRRTGRDAYQLSRAGNWAFSPEKFRRHQYRHTLEEALRWAEKVRNTSTFQGVTWTEMQVHHGRG